MKSKVQKSSNQICQMFEDINPSFYSIHAQQNLIIICQSPDDHHISKQVSSFIFTSVRYFLANLGSFKQYSCSSSSKQFHKTRIANMIISCRQFIQQNDINGSCSFGLCYVIKNQLFCFRSQGIQAFLFNEEGQKMRGLNCRQGYGQSKRQRNKFNYTFPYFSKTMPKIKAEYIYEEGDPMKRYVIFQYINLDKSTFPKIGTNLLIGCSETFDILTADFLFHYFKMNQNKSDSEKVSCILQQAKRKSKSVHRQDLSLYCWKFHHKCS